MQFILRTQSNVIARGKTSFMSSIIVACRKILEESTAYFEDILPTNRRQGKKYVNKSYIRRIYWNFQ